MASISERLAYVLTFDVAGGVKSLQKVGDEADKQLGKVDDRSARTAANLQKAGAAAVAFAGVAGAGLFKLARGAAEAEAGMAALEQVVGETVAQQIGLWADGAAVAVGLSSRAAVDAATSFAQLGSIIGLGGEELGKFSTDLTVLAADFAAFKNVTPEQALRDIQSAFAGSTEVMRKYGIFLDDASLKAAYFRETGETVSGTLTAQQKIVATNAELYRQGADMLGQWGRESGELAGLQAQLSANLTNLGDKIGAGVLPHVTNLVGAVNSLASGFASMDDATGGTIGGLATLGVTIAAVGGGLMLLVGKLMAARDAARSFGAAHTVAAGSIGAVTAVLAVLQMQSMATARATKELTETISDMSSASDDALLDQFIKALISGSNAGKTLDDVLLDIGKTSPGTVTRLLELERATGAVTEAMRTDRELRRIQSIEDTDWIGIRRKAREQYDAEFVALGRLETAQEAIAATLRQTAATRELDRQATEDATAALSANTATVTSARSPASQYAGRLREVSDATRIVREVTERAEEAIRSKTEATMESFNADLGYRNSVASTAAALEDLVGLFLEGKAGTDEWAAASRRAEGEILSQADAAVRLAQNQAEVNGETLTAAEKAEVYRAELQRLSVTLAPGSELRRQIVGYIAELQSIPRDVSTRVSTVGTRGPTGGSRGYSHTGSVMSAGDTRDVLPGQAFQFTAPANGRMLSQSESQRFTSPPGVTVNVMIDKAIGAPTQQLADELGAMIDRSLRGLQA